jgi:hypothetical protein
LSVELERVLDGFEHAFFVISLNITRWMLALESRISSAMCQAMASPSRSGSGASKHPRRPLGRGLDLRDDLLLAVDDDVLGLEIVLDIDADGGLGQVLDVSDGGLHLEPWPKVLLDGARLGRRLDDDQRAAHALGRASPLGLRPQVLRRLLLHGSFFATAGSRPASAPSC